MVKNRGHGKWSRCHGIRYNGEITRIAAEAVSSEKNSHKTYNCIFVVKLLLLYNNMPIDIGLAIFEVLLVCD